MPRKWSGEGRPKLLWGVCIKRERERVGEEWRTGATDRRDWIVLIENVVRGKLQKKRQGKRKSR